MNRILILLGVVTLPWPGVLVAQTNRTTTSSASLGASQLQPYLLGQDVIVKNGRNLVQLLKGDKQQGFTPEPVVVMDEPAVLIRSQHRGAGRDERHVIRLSTNLVALCQRLAHAAALDEVEPGYSKRYVRLLHAREQAEGKFALPPIEHPQAWTLNVLNQQAGLFRAMSGGIVAVEIVHHRDGVCAKHQRVLAADGGPTAALASVVTESQWRHAIREGARLGVKAGIDPDGLGTLFKLVSALPSRPPWANEMILPKLNLRGTLSDLNDIEMYYQFRDK